MYRVPAVLILSASALGPAQASSFVEVGLPAATPSIIAAGVPAGMPPHDPAGERFAVSASVLAIGAEAIPPAREEVASVAQDEPRAPDWASDAVPDLMRGGMVAETVPPGDF